MQWEGEDYKWDILAMPQYSLSTASDIIYSTLYLPSTMYQALYWKRTEDIGDKESIAPLL